MMKVGIARDCLPMKPLNFSFKNEAIWIVILSVAQAVVGLLVLLAVWFRRY